MMGTHYFQIQMELNNLSHHKNLNKGDYIIDDRDARGVKQFEGEHIHFGPDGKYKTWDDVMTYLMGKNFKINDKILI